MTKFLIFPIAVYWSCLAMAQEADLIRPELLNQPNPHRCEEALGKILGYGKRVVLSRKNLVVLDTERGKVQGFGNSEGGRAWQAGGGKCIDGVDRIRYGNMAINEVQSIIWKAPTTILNPAATSGATYLNPAKVLALESCKAFFNGHNFSTERPATGNVQLPPSDIKNIPYILK